MQLSFCITFYYNPLVNNKMEDADSNGNPKSAGKLQKLLTRNISKRFEGQFFFFFKAHRFIECGIFGGEHRVVFPNSDES